MQVPDTVRLLKFSSCAFSAAQRARLPWVQHRAVRSGGAAGVDSTAVWPAALAVAVNWISFPATTALKKPVEEGREAR